VPIRAALEAVGQLANASSERPQILARLYHHPHAYLHQVADGLDLLVVLRGTALQDPMRSCNVIWVP